MFYFPPLPGYFSPFPHGTRALSVASLYLALRGGPRRFTRAFPDPVLLGNSARRSLPFVYGAFTLCGAPFQSASTRYRLGNSLERLPPLQAGPTTPPQHRRQAVPLWRVLVFPLSSPPLRGARGVFFFPGASEFLFPPRPPPPPA